jgi:hypothetical protein
MVAIAKRADNSQLFVVELAPRRRVRAGRRWELCPRELNAGCALHASPQRDRHDAKFEQTSSRRHAAITTDG